MLTAAKSSVQSGEGNGLLNNNTLDVLKGSQLMDASSSQSRSHLTVYRDIRPINSLASTSNVNTPNSTPTSTNDGLESGGKSEQCDELSNDKFHNFIENSTKVAGTWCPPIQALSSQTANLFPETNGKKPQKTSRDFKDNAPNIRSENAIKIPIERIVRAPCVKLEPQAPQKSLVYSQIQSLHKCNGVNPVVSVPLIKKEEPIVVSVQNEVQPFTALKTNNPTEMESSTSGMNDFVTSVTSVKTSETLDKKTFFLAVTPTMRQNIQQESTSPITENLMENERFTPASPVPTDGSAPTRKPCNCTKSSCLKLYCECFAQGITCSKCNCTNCMNNEQHEEERSRSIKMILVRNPAAFQSKIERSYGHVKGCNCKKSNCLKNYCECYEAKMACTSLCRCLGCQNTDHSQAMEIVRRSVYAKIMNKETPSGIYNSPSTSSSAPENSLEASIVHYPDLKRTIVKQSNMCDSSIDTTNATQFTDKMNNQKKRSRFADSTVIVSTAPISPMDEKDKTFVTRIDEPQSPRSNSLKRIRPNASDRRNVTSSASGMGTSIDGASNMSSEEVSTTKATKPLEGMVNLNQTIDDVVAAYVIPESRRQKTVPCSSSLSLPIAKRARISVGAESGTSGGSSCNSSTHFSLPLSDDVSSDTSGPREDEFTAEEIALMKGIRGRFSNTTDTPPTSTNPAVEDDMINPSADECITETTFQKMGKKGQSEIADTGEDISTTKQIDNNEVIPISDCLSVSTASSSERQEDTSRRNLVVLPDTESPNILSFLQSSQLQIESAINGSASGVKGTCAPPAAVSAPNSTPGGSKLLYSILNPSSRIGLVPSPGGVHRASSTFRPLTVTTASVLNGNNNGCGNSNGNSGSVVHWRPQPQPTNSSLPTSQQQRSQSPQQFSPVLSPDVTVVQSTTLSQLSDLVDGENGLRAQVTALERQVSEMRRSQLHQTRMLTAIHRALIRRQSHQPIGLSHWNSISSSSSSTSSFLQRRRRRFRWRLPRDGCKDI